MNKEQLEQAIHQAFPKALFVSVEEDTDPSGSSASPVFSGVLADAAFDSLGQSERFYHFMRALMNQLDGTTTPDVRLRLLSADDFLRLTGRVA